MGNTKTADTIGTSVLELAKFNEARQNSFEEIMLIEISMTTKIKPEMEISISKVRYYDSSLNNTNTHEDTIILQSF
jgi:hypothetical protein